MTDLGLAVTDTTLTAAGVAEVDCTLPAGTVNLQFTLTHPIPTAEPGDPPVQDIIGISFTDDLDAAPDGLLATGLAASECGGTASFSITLTNTGDVGLDNVTVTDAIGTPLDSDGDSVSGGDFVLPFFRADPLNLLANGHFDECPATIEP